MHSRSLDPWSHEHVFLGAGHARNERRTWLVVGLTATMMIAEIVGGIVFGSMALLADGRRCLPPTRSGSAASPASATPREVEPCQPKKRLSAA
jgi:hypothetical protein